MMEQMDNSQFKPYSYGYVADNKALSSKIINVIPVDQASMTDGEITSNPTDITSDGVDKDGNKYKTSVTNDNVIECTWLPFGSNRVTPPDVRRGEPVLIWNYGSTDKYYWTILGLSDDLRRLETVVYAFNGNPDTASKEFDPDDHYFVEISTHSKQVTFRTSNKNGEPFKYSFQFNTEEGKVTLMDDTNNYIELDSKAITLKSELYTGTKIHMERDKILAETTAEIKLKVGGTEMIFTPASTTLKTPQFFGVRG